MTFKPNPQVQVKYTKIFINDEWQNSVSGKKIPVFNPSTNEKICDVEEGDKADVDKAVASAKTAFKNGSVWRTMNAYERGRLLSKFADLVERDMEYLANLLTLENGKPFKHAVREINFSLETLRYYAGCADKIHGKTIPVDGNSFAYTRVEPVGICALILSIGRQIQEAVGKSKNKRMSFIMGGNNPLVVCSDIEDLDEAVQIAHRASFYNQGEGHCAGNRIFVQDGIYDSFVAKSKELALKRVVGDPFDEKTEQGPQIDELQLNKLLEFIESGKREGAVLECGGSRYNTKGYFMQPTIFSNVQDHMRLTEVEILGPVMQISKFSTFDEVIERSNSYGHGLAAGILTTDLNKATIYSQQVRAGLIWINCFLNLSVQAPLGGFHTAGGKDFGVDAMNSFIETKTVNMMISQKK
ncbi:retinal dehydrogenase 2 [Parasteatoda tepidariorum]|uniref:retinal dehydrogenase 2 n=1 Tax=Parasteatoda tepidariorum TaxID=114398 RepID=UPI0039BCD55D